jgi:hypothetical protein
MSSPSLDVEKIRKNASLSAARLKRECRKRKEQRIAENITALNKELWSLRLKMGRIQAKIRRLEDEKRGSSIEGSKATKAQIDDDHRDNRFRSPESLRRHRKAKA